MAFPAYSKLVFIDGVRVPCTGFSGSWGDDGVIQFQVDLVPSYKAFRILSSSVVMVFHLESSKYVYRRTSVGVDLDSATGGINDSVDPRNVAYLKTDNLAGSAAETFGDLVTVLSGRESIPQVSDDTVLEFLADHGIIYQCGGFVDLPSESGNSSTPSRVTLICRGFEKDIEDHKLIQLVRGRGTLVARERRFFGQDSGREGKPLTVLAGSSGNSYADAVARLLTQEGDYAAGIRKIAAQYPALTNDMWLHRFGWTRLADQIAIIEGDAGPRRLIGTSTFKRFLREQLQRLYTVPLRTLLQLVLGFIGYKMVSIPAPAYFPIVPTPKAETKTRREETEETIKRGVTVRISWPAYTKYDPSEIPPGQGVSPGIVDGIYRIQAGDSDIALTTTRFGAGVTFGRLQNNNRRIDFDLPAQNGRGEQVLGGGVSLSIAALGYAPGDLTVPVPAFEVGKVYRVSGSVRITNPKGQGIGLQPGDGIHFKIEILRAGERKVKRVKTITEEIPPKFPPRYYGSQLCRLNTYAILPDLWFACPPACNIIVPEQIESWNVQGIPMNTRTRTLGKIPPGKPGSGKVLVDKFSAPNRDDLNEALEDVFDDPHDSTNLQRTEYIAGVQAAIEQFGHLAKMANASTWEKYISSMLTQMHWNQRFAPRQGVVVVKAAVGMVPGTTGLFIRGTGEDSQVGVLSPEEQALLAKLRKLRAILARLKKARAALLAHLRRARAVRRWIEQLQDLSVALHDQGVKDQVDPTTIQDAWTRTGDKLEKVKVGSATFLVRNVAESSVALGDQGVMMSSSDRLDPLNAKSLKGLNKPELGDLNDVSYQRTFRTLLGDDGLKIWPQGAEGSESPDRIDELPTNDELEKFKDKAARNVGGVSGCARALSDDIKMLSAVISELMAELRASAQPDASAHSVFAYIKNVREISSPEGGQQLWQVTLTHVRGVGEDLDWDGLVGDDLENTVIFGEDGYLDDKFHTENIGEKVYLPMFGTRSLIDVPGVQEAFDQFIREPLDAEAASITEILRRMRHPEVCGKKYYEDEASGVLPAKPDAVFAASWIIQQYASIKATGAYVSQDIFDWIERLTARPYMTLPDSFRGFPLGFDRRNEASTSVPHTDYEPWESDGVIYGYGLGRHLGRQLDDNDNEESPENQPPEGFWRRSIVPPFLSTLSPTELAALRELPPLENAGELQDYLRYAADLDEDEADFLQARQRRVQEYLSEVRYKTTSRQG